MQAGALLAQHRINGWAQSVPVSFSG